MDLREVERAVQRGSRGPDRREPERRGADRREAPQEPPRRPPASLRALPDDPATRLEREALMMIVQVPHLVGGDLIRRSTEAGFHNATLAVVRDAIASQLGALGGAGWLERLAAEVPEGIAPIVHELAFLPIPTQPSEDKLARLAKATVAALIDRHLLRQKADLVRQLQRTEGAADADRLRELRQRLVGVEADRRMLRQA
jgi:DNA primase